MKTVFWSMHVYDGIDVVCKYCTWPTSLLDVHLTEQHHKPDYILCNTQNVVWRMMLPSHIHKM